VEAFLVSTGLVAIAEIGDKTQLLAMILAARYRRPVPIILGILAATLANHALAAWCLIPDKQDDAPSAASGAGAFIATAIAFFLVEIGDKTQIATVALAARFDALAAVIAGTTLGMMIANVPAVLFGEVLARKVPLRLVRSIAALSFVVLGALVLWMPAMV